MPSSRAHDPLRPQSPEVYRRRRIAALVLVVVALALLVGLIAWTASLFRPADGEAGAPPAQASVSATPAPSAEGEATATADATADDGSPTETGEATADDGTPTATGEATSTPEASAATGTPASALPCQPGDLVISADTDRESYAEGQDPVLELRVDNTGDEPCAANLGTGQQAFTVYSGSDRIFSTVDCQVDGEDAVMEIAPDGRETSRFTWPRVRSEPGCGETASEPGSGTYRLEVSLGDLTAQPVTFTLP